MGRSWLSCAWLSSDLIVPTGDNGNVIVRHVTTGNQHKYMERRKYTLSLKRLSGVSTWGPARRYLWPGDLLVIIDNAVLGCFKKVLDHQTRQCPRHSYKSLHYSTIIQPHQSARLERPFSLLDFWQPKYCGLQQFLLLH